MDTVVANLILVFICGGIINRFGIRLSSPEAICMILVSIACSLNLYNDGFPLVKSVVYTMLGLILGCIIGKHLAKLIINIIEK